MKYIIVETEGIPVAILFSELLKHSEVAGKRKVVSAGFCNAEGWAWGASDSLGLRARNEDSEIIEQSITFRSLWQLNNKHYS